MNRLFIRSFRGIGNLLGAISLLFVSGTMGEAVIAQNYGQSIHTVTVFSENLNQPYWLIINAPPSTQISGEIRLNDRLIQRLNSPSLRLNLMPYLGLGRYRLEIIGHYTPSDNGIELSLSGGNTQINQRTAGSGVINHIINLEVK